MTAARLFYYPDYTKHNRLYQVGFFIARTPTAFPESATNFFPAKHNLERQLCQALSLQKKTLPKNPEGSTMPMVFITHELEV